MKYPKPKIIRDDEVLVKWAKENDMEDYIEEKFKWGEAKKQAKETEDGFVIEETGEIIPGITLEERPPVLEFKEE